MEVTEETTEATVAEDIPEMVGIAEEEIQEEVDIKEVKEVEILAVETSRGTEVDMEIIAEDGKTIQTKEGLCREEEEEDNDITEMNAIGIEIPL